MKRGQRVTVIASSPNIGQDEINKLIGKEFKVESHWMQLNSTLDIGEIQVRHEGHIYCLSIGEYELVH